MDDDMRWRYSRNLHVSNGGGGSSRSNNKTPSVAIGNIHKISSKTPQIESRMANSLTSTAASRCNESSSSSIELARRRRTSRRRSDEIRPNTDDKVFFSPIKVTQPPETSTQTLPSTKLSSLKPKIARLRPEMSSTKALITKIVLLATLLQLQLHLQVNNCDNQAAASLLRSTRSTTDKQSQQLSSNTQSGTGCPYPGTSQHSQVNIVAQAPAVPVLNTEYVADEYATLKPDTQASYKCDHGFELLGQETLTCLQSGRWSGSPPNCVTNIALGKPTNQSSTVKGGDSRNANDGKLITQHESKYCTETRVDQSPWWQIDLMQVYDIRSVRILGRACCNPQLAMHDIEIRVGNSSTLQGNRLCAWYPNNLDEGVAKDFQCANPILGRFVSIQMVGIESALSLCEVMVFSTKEFPAERCNIQSPTSGGSTKPSQVTTTTTSTTTTTTSATTTQQSALANGNGDNQAVVFSRTCYELQTTSGGSFLVADSYCKARGGSLVHSITDLTHNFISQGLEQMRSKLKSKLIWIGAKRENASPNSLGPITSGSTSALIASDSMLHHTSIRTGRSLPVSALNEFSVENLFASDRGQISPGEPSPIFSPLKLARTSLLQASSGAGGSTSRGSQTFGLSTAAQHLTNRTIEHPGRSLSIIQPNQVASFFAPPIPINNNGGSSAPTSILSNRQQESSAIVVAPQLSSASSSPISSFSSLSIPHGPHKSLRPPSLVSTSQQQSNSVSSSLTPSATSWGASQSVAPTTTFQSSQSNGNSAWRWIGDAMSDTLNSPISSFMWAEDQPNNYNNQQDCIVLDGSKKWLWNDVTCELDYLPWVCQYRPSGCGSPDRHENSTILELNSSSQDASSTSIESAFQFGKTITYACPAGHRLDGSRTRKCLYDGTWSGKAPKCQYINCGQITTSIENGRQVYLNQSQTTFGSQVKYVCYEDYVLVGDDTRQCQTDGKWGAKAPYCAYKWCPVLQSISNGQLNVSSYSENSLAIYQCNSGYKLIGNDTRQCLLGGKWTNQEPFCQYVDCGLPKQISNGVHSLINGTTNYLSIVGYTCNENYTLVNANSNKMICSHNNRWTGKEPQCSLIDCGQPLTNPGSRFTGDSFSVHSIIDYSCDPGFKEVSGNTQRTCGLDGQWTGQPLSCKYVDCGRVPAILKGEISYINGTTYLASQVSYECTPGNRLSGHRVRFCGPDGRWTGSSPKCEEVRCDAPQLPANGSAIYVGNDRSFKEQSFSVGVTVQYECDYGHVVRGSWSSRLCQANGEWSGEAPICKFVDCGPPPTIENGNYQLRHPPASSASNSPSPSSSTAIAFGDSLRRSSNVAGSGGGGTSSSLSDNSNGNTFTYYGTIAVYSCEPNFRLQGSTQRSECLENGQWRMPLPTCEQVQCPKPEFFDEYTQVTLIPRSIQQQTSDVVLDHQALIALAARSTKLIANNQWLVPNSAETGLSFGVGDKLHYSCLPGYELYGGPELRTCTQYGQWSGSSTPRCRLIDCNRPSPIGQEGRFYLLNETTTFNSIVEYSCVRPFKLIEVKIRQSGNLIETLQNAQAGVTPILTSLPIGVKVCANNGQWMPNDQQPKCVSSSSADGGSATSSNGNVNNNSGHFDGIDNTLDSSHRSVQVLAGTNNQRLPGGGSGAGNSNQFNADGLGDNNNGNMNINNLDNGYQQHQADGGNSARNTSFLAKMMLGFCLLVMLALIIMGVICMRSNRKPKQVQINRASILTPGGHQVAAAAAMQIQLANGKSIQPSIPQIPPNGQIPLHHNLDHHHHHNHTQTSLVAMQQQQQQQQHQAMSGQNIYINGQMHKMLASSMVGQSQMVSTALGGVVASQQNYHHPEHRDVMGSYGEATLTSNGALANHHHHHHQHPHHPIQHHHRVTGSLVADHGMGSGASSSSMMDTYSRLSVESDQTNIVGGNGGNQLASSVAAAAAATNKTIRHNPNGLVTFVSPAQQQSNKQQASAAVSSQSNHPNQQHQVSPQSISTSLSVTSHSSTSPSSSTTSSSAHHTTATRLSGSTDSASSPASSSSTNNNNSNNNGNTAGKQQTISSVKLINGTANDNNNALSSSDSGDYQIPTQTFPASIQPPPLPQSSPPSLPAQPPPSHRVQQHHKQLMKYSSRHHSNVGPPPTGPAPAPAPATSRANNHHQQR